MSGEYERDRPVSGGAPATTSHDLAPSSPVAQKRFSGEAAAGNGAGGMPKAVADVLYSDMGINTLLTRLKQSIASARDFAQFLKKRSALEEEQATGLKRLARAQLENIRKSEMRGGSYAAQLAEVLRVHERMGDNGMQFALSLHQMHEDLEVLSGNIERGRKTWKHEGLDAEKRAADAEQAMQKAKAKYDGLAEDYDRARTGDAKGTRRLGLKGPKSAEQYESDLLRKVEAADADYKDKVSQARAQREQLWSTNRPRAVQALQELIHECDSGLALQLQKFGTFNEKLLLGNGLAVSPMADKDGATTQRSLRDLISDVDNERDFHNYVSSFSGRVQTPAEIKYEQHPTLAPKQQQPTQPSQSSFGMAGAVQPSPSTLPGSQPASMNNRYAAPAVQPPPQAPVVQAQQPSFSQDPQSPPYRQQAAPYQPGGAPREPYNAPPYPTHPAERSAAPFAQQTTGSIPASGYPPAAVVPARPLNAQPVPTRPVFGVGLDVLFERDQSAVPMIVLQCIQAVEQFGLTVEGIYRLSGNTNHVNALRTSFDTLPPNAPQLNFGNPANYFHDINSVTTLLKQFFRELPDPLFTRVGYNHFIESAKIPDDDKRRDALHQGINDLPDPNYATLRAVVLHLWRVMQNESITRMGSANLAVCFAPSLMGQHTGAQIADAGLQARVLETILANATAIFDED